jgi:hypothetical protein
MVRSGGLEPDSLVTITKNKNNMLEKITIIGWIALLTFMVFLTYRVILKISSTCYKPII